MSRETAKGTHNSSKSRDIPLTPFDSGKPSHHRTAVHFTTPVSPEDRELNDELTTIEAMEHPLLNALERNRRGDARQNIRTPWKRTLYALFESPTSSSSAFVVHVVSTGLIVFSAIITMLETLPPFHSTPTSVWFGIETSLVVLFTIEYICRLLAHSESWASLFQWARSFFAIIDLLAIVPYYIEIALQADTTAFFRFSILRTFRLLRVFRPFRYSSTILLTIEVMYLAVKRSKDALFALGFFVLMALVVFSTLLYFAERGIWDTNLEAFVNSDGDPSKFESIPAAAWFVLVTITTVGYGEIIPRSFLGRLITVPLLMFGLLLIALPSFVLGREFSDVWEGMGGTELLRMTSRAQFDAELRDSEHGQRLMPPSSPRHSGIISPTPRRGSPAVYPPRTVTPPLPPVTPPTGHGSRRSNRRRSHSDAGITNLKLAQNQQILSSQLDMLLETVEALRNEVRHLSNASTASSSGFA